MSRALVPTLGRPLRIKEDERIRDEWEQWLSVVGGVDGESVWLNEPRDVVGQCKYRSDNTICNDHCCQLIRLNE